MALANILIVEDEGIVARDLQSKLSALGYTVSGVASSGEEALRKAAETRPDLVLMDIVLKGAMDGIDAAREMGRRWKIPIVYLTAYADEATLARAKETEPYGYLLKPFSERELRISIEMAIHKSRMERELWASEARKAAVLEAALDAVITIDHEGRIVEWNPAAAQTFGYTREEAVGQEMAELIVPPSLRAAHRQGLAHYLATGEGPVLGKHLEMPALRADGSEFPAEFAIARVPLDGHPLFTGYVRDITERRRTEEEVKRLHALTEAALTHLGLDDLLDELLLRIREVLAADTAAILLLEEDALVARAARGLEEEVARGFRIPIGAGFSGRVAAERRPIILDEVDDAQVLNPLLREKGIQSLLGAPLMVEGRVIGVVHVGALQPRRFTDDDARLLQLIADRAALAMDRAQLFHELREENRRKSEFLAMLAHELRNPLGAINNALALMRLRSGAPPGAGDPVLQHAQEVQERQVKHMARLLDDLLDISRLTRGKIALRKEPLDLAFAVAQAVQITRPLMEARRHDLSVSLPPEPVRLEADPTRLEQVLVNLLNNAAKYTDPGGRIALTVEREDDHAVLRVRDTGVGISRELLPRIFDLFAQADRSLDRSQGGLGIGLTLVKSLVEMHGGSVSASSDGPGRGSEFVVRLPALPDARAPEMPAAPRAEAAARRPRRILVVEDNADAAVTLVELLARCGHETYLAHDGPTAVEVARLHEPEVVLLDIGLPGMDGYEVARRLREQSKRGPVRLVAVTGYGQEEDRQRSRQAGFDHHLVKPVHFADLQEVLAALPAGA